MNPSELADARRWAFEQALESIPNGAKIGDVLKRAELIMAFVVTGKTE